MERKGSIVTWLSIGWNDAVIGRNLALFIELTELAYKRPVFVDCIHLSALLQFILNH